MKCRHLSVLVLVGLVLCAQTASWAQNAAPSIDALMALEKQANEAANTGNAKFFDGILSDKFVTRMGEERLNKAATLKALAGLKCDVKTLTLDEPTLTKIDPDTYVLIYRNQTDGTCTNSVKIESPTRTATVWVRSGDKWLAAFHAENVIVDPKDTRAATDAAKPTPKRPDALTASLAAIESAVWEAWRLHDRERVEGLVADSVAFIDIFGNAYSKRKDIVDVWSSSICKVSSTAVTDAIAFSLSPTVKLLTHTGTANGTCFGAKIGPIYGNSLYVKQGSSWKLAFTMNMPAN